MPHQTQATPEPWQHRKEADPQPRAGWELYDSNGDWLATFRIEGDCLGFISAAGPRTVPRNTRSR